MTTQAPASWDWVGQIWALFPLMVVFMVLMMAYKLANKILEPETLREVGPIIEQVLLAKGGTKLLPGGK